MIASLLFCVISRDFFGNPFGVPSLSVRLVLDGAPMALLGVGNVATGLM